MVLCLCRMVCDCSFMFPLLYPCYYTCVSSTTQGKSMNPAGLSLLPTLGVAWKPTSVAQACIEIPKHSCTFFLESFSPPPGEVRISSGLQHNTPQRSHASTKMHCSLFLPTSVAERASCTRFPLKISHFHMTLEKDLAAFSGAGGRAEVTLPILCPSDLLDHQTCSPLPQGLHRWFCALETTLLLE